MKLLTEDENLIKHDFRTIKNIMKSLLMRQIQVV